MFSGRIYWFTIKQKKHKPIRSKHRLGLRQETSPKSNAVDQSSSSPEIPTERLQALELKSPRDSHSASESNIPTKEHALKIEQFPNWNKSQIPVAIHKTGTDTSGDMQANTLRDLKRCKPCKDHDVEGLQDWKPEVIGKNAVRTNITKVILFVKTKNIYVYNY
ncbi:uncharacterized protein LOC114245292 isoform X1 [Bombyx mandarina]|uniref:Uncharacterized protein LOC114245292 isoform X1 n=1 Tax=Bombyx mandarina TaxID=7092 RepID=A0A6J2JYL8_BOMMA|nr:uncharacterized protein LOC114245292 isoform X1 [Bombyx mandarina]